MRIRVRHETRYHYDQPITYAIQSIRLTPQDCDGQKVISWQVYDDSGTPFLPCVDGFGNIVHLRTLHALHDQSKIVAEGVIETTDRHGLVGDTSEPLPANFYLRPTEMTWPTPEIRQLAAEENCPPTLDGLHSLSVLIRDRVEYQLGTTQVHTTAHEALIKGAGVCQDHAHLFITVCRLMGVPARYVGGYLVSGEAGAVYDASHAWAEAFVPDLGWVGFDVANRVCPTDDHIRVAVGPDYWAAAPVRGLRHGIAGEELEVRLTVEQMEQAQQ